MFLKSPLSYYKNKQAVLPSVVLMFLPSGSQLFLISVTLISSSSSDLRQMQTCQFFPQPLLVTPLAETFIKTLT